MEFSMNQRKIEEIAWNSWNHLVFRLRPFQQNFILFRISLYCLASDEHTKKRKGFSSSIQIFEAIRTNDDLEMRQKRIKSLRCGSSFLDNLSESSMLTSRKTSMQSYKIRFIRDWKFSGALHSPMGITKNSNWLYLVLNAVFSIPSDFKRIWGNPVLRSLFAKSFVYPSILIISSERYNGGLYRCLIRLKAR